MKQKGSAINPNCLWMGDLQPHMDERFITWAFSQMGVTIDCVKLIRDKQTGVPAGYCFVEFKDADSATNALLKLNGKGIPGSKPHRLFKLNQASFGREHLQIPEYSLYVGELSPDVDDMALFSAFSKRYKSVRAAKVVLDDAGKHRGYGFVRFTNQSEQQLALVEMQNFYGLGSKLLRISLPKKGPGSATNYSQVAPPPPPENYNQYNYYHQTPQAPQSYYPGYEYYDHNAAAQYWGDYTTQYYAAYGQEYSADPYQQYGQQQVAEQQDSDDETLVDPQLEIDVEKENKEFMEKSEEFYIALEGSRWHPLDNVFSTIIPQPPQPADT